MKWRFWTKRWVRSSWVVEGGRDDRSRRVRLPRSSTRFYIVDLVFRTNCIIRTNMYIE